MIIKVCGMRDADNIEQVSTLKIDMMGFIFYAPSSRYITDSIAHTPKGISRVGVFVDEDLQNILSIAAKNNLTHIQLHGNESIETCNLLRQANYTVIKAITVAAKEDILITQKYQGFVDVFLFDTKCSCQGGSGIRFDWKILDYYKSKTPFLLSGGINSDSAQEIKKIKHPMFIGVDLNSRFETQPAMKDTNKLKQFINDLKYE